MGHERRWEPPIARMLAEADAGELGRIHQIEANFSHDKFLALDRDNWRLKADQAPAGGMTATGIHLLDLSVRLLGPAESVLCICEQLSSDLPQGDTVAAYVRFRGGGTSYVSASLANPFMSRFTVYGSKGWIDIRDKAHVEAPDGWIVTSATVGGPITTVEVPPAEPVKDNLVSFARAVRGVGELSDHRGRISSTISRCSRRSSHPPRAARSKPWPDEPHGTREGTMKALFFDEPKKPVVSQVQSPSITENEVMIRSRRVGICHSDYELLAGQYIIPISYPGHPRP